jgi:hypothetical protein
VSDSEPPAGLMEQRHYSAMSVSMTPLLQIADAVGINGVGPPLVPPRSLQGFPLRQSTAFVPPADLGRELLHGQQWWPRYYQE